MFPKKTKEYEWMRAGDFYVLYDPVTNESFNLDPIAFIVWLQCDGKTHIDEIVDLLSVENNKDIIKAAVSGIIDRLAENGIIKK
ncbi:MAG: PqqD family protein [Candidatus Aenigmarchaeota archaeon]|nr:PqqD family protein [Candidatus Aenigmarchaeota archaeon]